MDCYDSDLEAIQFTFHAIMQAEELDMNAALVSNFVQALQDYWR